MSIIDNCICIKYRTTKIFAPNVDIDFGNIPTEYAPTYNVYGIICNTSGTSYNILDFQAVVVKWNSDVRSFTYNNNQLGENACGSVTYIV